ncbi:MAG: tail fiber domain-containing protein [candidate division Zixibacteria bacterium]|nr:tail fiber domain-containing protein [candidate division Zixibacteria bacterium]
MKRFRMLLAVGILVILNATAWGQVPNLINVQGVLRDGSGNLVPDGSYSVLFSIYSVPSGGTALWSETQTVTTTAGAFQAALGSVNNVPDFVSVFGGLPAGERYLGITVGADPEMTPRMQFASIPYSQRVGTVDGATGGEISGDVTINQLQLGGLVPTISTVQGGVNMKLEFNMEGISIGGAEGVLQVVVNPSSPGAPEVKIEGSSPALKFISTDPLNGASIDLTTVLLHEFGHGLGFSSFLSRPEPDEAFRFRSTYGDIFTLYHGRNAKFWKDVDIDGILKIIGGILLPQGAGPGKVLTSDGSGAGNWQTPVGNIGGSGTAGRICRFFSPNSITDSKISEGPTALSVDGRLNCQAIIDEPSLQVRQTTAASPTSDIFKVSNSSGTVDYLKVDALGAIDVKVPTFFEGPVTYILTTSCSPTTDVTGLTVRQTTFPSPTADVIKVTNPTGAQTYLRVKNDGATECNGTLTCNAPTTCNNLLTCNAGVVSSGNVTFDGVPANAVVCNIDLTVNDFVTLARTMQFNLSNDADDGVVIQRNSLTPTGKFLNCKINSGASVASVDPNGQGNFRYLAVTNGFVNTGIGGPPLNLTAGAPGGPGANLNLFSASAVASLTASLGVNGDLCATGLIGPCSDRRYKTNFRKISDALDKVQDLKGVYFNWRKDEFPEKRFAEGNQIGFVAQELKDVLPEAVSQDKDGYFMVDYGRITPLLVEALKEQQKQIEGLKDRISELEQSRPQAKLEE